jgi:RNA polymerase sigma-70 factor (ECF subfamily)
MIFKRQDRKRELEELFHREAMPHADALFGAAMRLTRSQRDAEDLVQDTLMKAFVHFERYKAGTNCKAWLFKILTNTFINRYRKKQRERVFLADDDEGRPLAERIESRPESEYEYRDESIEDRVDRLFGDEVGAALQAVPLDFRLAVLYADVYDFSYKECSDILDCPIGTVMSRLYRGRRLLRAQLAEYAQRNGYIEAISDEYQEQIDTDRNKTVDLNAYRRSRTA